MNDYTKSHTHLLPRVPVSSVLRTLFEKFRNSIKGDKISKGMIKVINIDYDSNQQNTLNVFVNIKCIIKLLKRLKKMKKKFFFSM